MIDAAFRTPAGRPVPAVTAGEMRELDRVAVEEVGLELLQMMENAGRNLAGAAREMRRGGVGADEPSPDAGNDGDAHAGNTDPDGGVLVLAGAGGNGGGGLCCARHLANHGTPVRVALDRDPDALEGAAATQYRVLSAMDVPLVGDRDVPAAAAAASLVVDALVGYSLDGPLRGRAADLAGATEAGDRVLSLDVPSGLDATTGARPGPAVTPDRTLTLALPKTGLAEAPATAVGDLDLADIAVPAVAFRRAGIDHASPFDGDYRLRLTR